ncbi:NACHT and WD repeat domain-containing protein [Amycolatopsis sp. NPDC098790]|uniref:NACHT and WD repeat domain-containing protein n=1 Tax=Amycolatopsis sp. NPDC098790 TaxID=3363939 RepID=UPI00381987E1
MPRSERPLDAGDTALLRFAADLRRLREKAGGPSYRSLAVKAHYSATVLSEAAGGRKLPSWPVTRAYVLACAGDAAEWEQRWQEIAAGLAAETASAGPADGEAPYLGLAAFQAKDADRFFGRRRLVEELLDRLSHKRFVAVFGASGAGKSSVLRAGLVPRLRAGADSRLVLVQTPGARPLEKCAARLAALTGDTAARVHQDLTEDPSTLHRLVDRALAGRGADAELVLVVDQFEEVFTPGKDDTEHAGFLDALVAAAGTRNSRCRVVAGVRSDFYAHCTAHPGLVEAMRDAQVVVGPMSAEELTEAVTRPAALAGYQVESALLATLVAQAGNRAGMLPLLSHALFETWRRRRGFVLGLAGFEAAGGIDGALAQTAEAVFAELAPAQQDVARRLFLRLTAFGDGTQDTKRRVSRDELDPADADLAVVLDALAAARLLVLDRDSVEIAHEALIRCWPRLRDWLSEDRDGRRVHRQLTDATGIWESVDRDPGALYRGTRLAVARDWAAGDESVLTARERAFLAAGVAAETAERLAARRRARRLRQLVALLSVLLVLATAATAFAFDARLTATRQRNVALSEKVAGQAAALRTADPPLAAQLGLAAYRLVPTAEARSALLSGFATPYAVRLTGHTGNVNAVAVSRDRRLLASGSRDATVRLWDLTDQDHPVPLATITGHPRNVNAVAFSPDGGLLATGSWDHTAALWDVRDPRAPRKLATLAGHSDDVNAVAFSPDGRTLATGSTDHTVRLWNLADPGRAAASARVLTGQDGGVVAVAFSPDGRTLATAGWDGTAGLWDLSGGPAPPRLLAGHRGPVVWVAFSPGGRLLATAGQDHTVRLWDVADPARPAEAATLTGHTDVVRAAAFSPDGKTLATAGLDRRVRLWDVTDPRRTGEPRVLTGHTGGIASLVFAPDGHSIATGSDDRTVWVWDLPGPVLTGHRGSVCGLAFSPDRRTLATGSWDRTARLWDVTDPRHPVELATVTAHTDSVCGLAFAPDGRTLATTSYDHTARLWDVTDPRRPAPAAVLAGCADNANGAAFSPDGRTLAVACLDRTARLWDVTDPGRPAPLPTLRGHSDGVNAVAFGPDGRTLATASWDHTIRLWDLTNPRDPGELATLPGHDDGVSSVAFSPDGRRLASGSWDRTARLWDVADRRHPVTLATLTGHSNTVFTTAFGADGSTLVTAGADRTVLLWSLADPARPAESATLTGHLDRVYLAAFGADGHTLATAGADGTVRLWETDPERAAARVCAAVEPAITAAQWAEYLPDIAYRPPCR